MIITITTIGDLITEGIGIIGTFSLTTTNQGWILGGILIIIAHLLDRKSNRELELMDQEVHNQNQE